jgi:hypothetical protein
MGRSFSAAHKAGMWEGLSGRPSYYHQPSGRYYTMIERGGRYFQRRYQLTPEGAETNVVEKEIHFVMGSGNHARTYLHRTADGKLLELPLAWYAEGGGHWAMNPGYDRLDHPAFRRAIPDDCMFCHNSYPNLEPGSRSHGASAVFPSALPEGIGCERCHGPGGDHAKAAGATCPPGRTRLTIAGTEYWPSPAPASLPRSIPAGRWQTPIRYARGSKDRQEFRLGKMESIFGKMRSRTA